MSSSTTKSSQALQKNSIRHTSQGKAAKVGTILFQHLLLYPDLCRYRDGRMYHCPWSRGPGKARDGVMMVAVARPGGGPAQASSGQRGLASRWTGGYPYNRHGQWNPTSLAVATGDPCFTLFFCHFNLFFCPTVTRFCM